MNGSGKKTIRVLIADDSTFFQQRIERILQSHPDIQVVAVAANGREALEKTERYQPDVITMDYEMPEMDGLTAVKAIMSQCPTPILMFSSLTYDGARITLDALSAGAVDFLPKNFAEVSRGTDSVVTQLHEKIMQLARQRNLRLSSLPSGKGIGRQTEGEVDSKNSIAQSPPSKPSLSGYSQKPTAIAQPSTAFVRPLKARSVSRNLLKSKASIIKPMVQGSGERRVIERKVISNNVRSKINGGKSLSRSSRVSTKAPKVVLLGASTGGPVAVSDILKALPQNFPVPIVIIQHMPEQFTKAFAERLDRQCQIKVIEGRDGDELKVGQAILAPGGQQMVFNPRQPNRLNVILGDEQMNYRPALDITFASAAKVYADQALAIVLTGMGSDGCRGGQLMHQQGATLWAQDQATSVIYGMPKAITDVGVVDQVLPLAAIAEKLKTYCL